MVNRLIEIRTLDSADRPIAGANITVTINGRPGGKMRTGSNSQSPATLELDDAEASVELLAEFRGQTRSAEVAPEQNAVLFKFEAALHFPLLLPAIAECPDGTTGSPCVICRDGPDVWKMCS